MIYIISCGYRSNSIYMDAETVAVPVFENDTLWRELERDLTDEVVRQISSRTPFRPGTVESADLIVEGEITDVRRPVIGEDDLDRVIRSSAQYTVQVVVREGTSGDVVREDEKTFQIDYSGRRGQDFDTARAQVDEDVGRWVTRLLETSEW